MGKLTNSPFEIDLINLGGVDDTFIHGWPNKGNNTFTLGASRVLALTPAEAEEIGKALVGWAEEQRKANDPAQRTARALDPADALVNAWEAWFNACQWSEGPWSPRRAAIAEEWRVHTGNWQCCLRGWNNAGPLPPAPPAGVIDAATGRILARIEQENAPEEPPPFPPVAWPLTIKCEVDPELDSFTLHHNGGGFTLAARHTDPSASFVDAGRWVNVMLSSNDARLLARAILAKLGDE